MVFHVVSTHVHVCVATYNEDDTCTCMTVQFTLYLGWTQMNLNGCLYISKLDVSRPVPDLLFNIVIRGDLTWMIYTCGVEITSGALIKSLPPKLDSVYQVKSLLLRRNCCHVCSGNSDGKFHDLKKKQQFIKSSSKYYTCRYIHVHKQNTPAMYYCTPTT